MIIKTETINGRQIEIHEHASGHRRFWAKVDQQELLKAGSLRERLFTTADAARAAALKETEISQTDGLPVPGARARGRGARQRTREKERENAGGPRPVPGYSNFGGGGPFAPMGTPPRTPK